MLDEFNPNDANSLNSAFYEELLYILGLCEVKESSKLLIKPSSQSANTLYNAILAKLPQDKQGFERVMSFVVLWLNRILFLKLIEANLVRFNNDESLKFLNPNKVRNFKALSQLFFEILAKKPKDRANSTLDYLPYLNSALFQKQAIEREILDISALDDSATLPYFAKTQIKDKNAKKKAGSVPLLVYIFEFLDAFDFGSDEKSPELALQKELISSSVLGLVFEKLNGYKEGSFYTPSFITSYMCRASLEKVILSKFNDKFKWQCEDLKALRERIDRDFSTKAQEFKAVLNSIRICDPAVGSGHFLVSALNEMIAIYHALGLAQRLNPCELALLSDELVITKPNGEIYAYKKPKIKNDESHAIQKALFTLKKQIIENNLFGVDINENSCEITKLRLWIELLKNSYYLQKDDEGFDENLNDEIHQMQTLPNIDINIKCGNSLISYFELNRSLTHYPNIKERMQKYKSVIKDYKDGFFDDKMRIEKEIKALKESFRTFCFKDKFNKEIKAFTAKCEAYSKKYGNFLAKDDENLSLYIAQSFSFFDFDENKARLEFNALKKEYESIFNLESKKPFEWRFEFPEVLDYEGNFKGFDLIIGNPPYIDSEYMVKYMTKDREIIKNRFKVAKGNWDIYIPFFEQGLKIGTEKSLLAFITPDKWIVKPFGLELRKAVFKYVEIIARKGDVFDSATIDSIVTVVNKNTQQKNIEFYLNDKKINFIDKKLIEISKDFSLDCFYNNSSIIDILRKDKISLNSFALCVSACATADAYKLKPYIKELEKVTKDTLYIINTGTIGKYVSKFGLKSMKYLKDTYNKPYCTKQDFNSHLGKKYNEVALSKKIIIKGLTLLDACLDLKGDIIPAKSTIVVIDDDNTKLKFLSAIINSKLAFFYIKELYSSNSYCGGINFTRDMIGSLPIPKINSKNQNLVDEIINLVNQILALKAENSSADISKLEKDIDNLIYKLYNLTPKEIEIIERR